MTSYNKSIKSERFYVSEGRIVQGILKERNIMTKITYLVFTCILFIIAFQVKNILTMILCVLVVMAIFLEKKQIIDQKGIQIVYNMQFKTYIDQWPWDIITSLHWEERPPNTQVALHFGKGTITRRFFINKKDLNKVLTWAKKTNPTVYIGSVKN